jgi:hypothetical protein
LAAAALAAAGLLQPVHAAEGVAPASETSAELRLHWDARTSNAAGPLAAANALVPGISPGAPSAAVAEAELRDIWRLPDAPTLHPSIAANALLWSERPEGGATQSHARFNELHAALDFGAWQASAGKRIVAWDVGYAFRPNDVVQQEVRRTLLSVTQEGRSLIEVERYRADTATALVWVNPQHANRAAADQRGALESALAARVYRRDGSADWHLFGRWGEHTKASAGVALAWVASDELELHASLRALQRHDGWHFDARAGDQPVAANPWQQATRGGTAQALLGASWTGAQQQSVLVEWWTDGSAPADSEWDAWGARNRALAALGSQASVPPALRGAAAGNLAWQATPLSTSSLRRDNVFARVAWQPDRWLVSLDTLLTPADRGRIVTAGVQWQGERVRLNAAWRVYGGPADSLLAQLPQRTSGVLAATWTY